MRFFFPEVPNAMTLGWGAIPRLVALAGSARTKRIVLFGEFLDAEMSSSRGFADEFASAGEAHVIAGRWAAKIAKLPPLAVRATKEAVDSYSTALNALSDSVDRNGYLLAGHMGAGVIDWVCPPQCYQTGACKRSSSARYLSGMGPSTVSGMTGRVLELRGLGAGRLFRLAKRRSFDVM